VVAVLFSVCFLNKFQAILIQHCSALIIRSKPPRGGCTPTEAEARRLPAGPHP
jgi:hypothetical protein